MNELVIKDGQLTASEEFKILLTEYRVKELVIEENKDDMKVLNDMVQEALTANNLKTVEFEDSEGVTHVFTRKDASVRTSADVQKMKADGIFEYYSKSSPVKASITHTIK